MKRSWRWIAVCTLVSLAGAAHVMAKPSPAVVVHVQPNPNILRNLHVSFRPTDRLPPGGYYYAVIVLQPYRGYTRNEPPPCAISSDMSRTYYGYSYDHRTVTLTLGPAESRTGHWCQGGTYIGGIYAVPHPPPCEGKYPCRSEPYEKRPVEPRQAGPCGGRVCGVVRIRRYSYPDGLPKPLASDTRIIGHFQVLFPASR